MILEKASSKRNKLVIFKKKKAAVISLKNMPLDNNEELLWVQNVTKLLTLLEGWTGLPLTQPGAPNPSGG